MAVYLVSTRGIEIVFYWGPSKMDVKTHHFNCVISFQWPPNTNNEPLFALLRKGDQNDVVRIGELTWHLFGV